MDMDFFEKCDILAEIKQIYFDGCNMKGIFSPSSYLATHFLDIQYT